MKKLSLLLTLTILLTGNVNAQKNIKSDRNSTLYKDTTTLEILESIFPGESITPLKEEGRFYKIRFKNNTGYILKSDYSPLPIKTTIADDCTDDEILSAELAKLSKYTKQNKRAINAMYVSIGVGIVFTGWGTIESVLKSVTTDGPYSGPIAIPWTIAGIAGLSALISGTCALQFQIKFNKTNTKIQYLGNGLKVKF